MFISSGTRDGALQGEIRKYIFLRLFHAHALVSVPRLTCSGSCKQVENLSPILLIFYPLCVLRARGPVYYVPLIRSKNQ